MAKKYTRVRDKRTKHEYDVLVSQFDPDKHAHVNRAHYPDVAYPRPAKPHIPKGGRAAAPDTEQPVATPEGES